MNIEIPAELLYPTVEELDERTERDLAAKWRPCKKLGKKERNEMKREMEAARIREIASEFGKPRPPSRNSLSALFVNNEKQEFSLATVNNPVNNQAKPSDLRPTVRASMEKITRSEIITSQILEKPVRKRGRPPKVTPL